jgi:hypothetical protein
LQLRSLLLGIINIVSLIIIIVIVALSGLPRSFAAEQPSDVPVWLRTHIGEGEGQITQVVLQRARALYLRLHHLVAVGRRANHPDGEGADDALHLS